jgi:hypothetical protein
MKRLLIGAALCALFAAPGLAGEPAKLSLAQMDQVTAGNPCSANVFSASVGNACIQANNMTQAAVAVSGFVSKASNENETQQVMGDNNFAIQ